MSDRSEYLTRKEKIDPLLFEQGWDFSDRSLVRVEIDTKQSDFILKDYRTISDTLRNDTESRYADYLLLDSAGAPLAVVEAKRPSKDPIVAQKQDEEYADDIRSQTGRDIFIFLTNGKKILFGDPVTNPMGWETKKLGEVSEVVSGVTKGRKLEGPNITKAPYLRVANVQDGFLDLSEMKEIETIPSDISKYALLKGDILLTEGGDLDKLGRGAIRNEEIPNCIHQNHIFRVRIQNSNLVPDYLSMLIGSNYGKRYFLKAAKKTTGIASINLTQLKNFPVIISPLDVQITFKHIITEVNTFNKKLIKSRSKANNLYDTLMAKAFTGELVA